MCVGTFMQGPFAHTAIPIIIEGRFQVFQRFSSSKLVLKTIESCFTGLNYYDIGSSVEFVIQRVCVYVCMCVCIIYRLMQGPFAHSAKFVIQRV